MQTLAAKDVPAQFMEILFQVQNGEHVAISTDDDNHPVAMLIPYPNVLLSKRTLGVLEGKMSVEFSNDFEMSIEELIGE